MNATDPAHAVAALRAADPDLARVIDAVGPCLLEPNATRSVYEAVARAIVFQQLSGRAAATIFGRVAALGGESFPHPAALLALPEDALRSAGLSRAKAAALRDLATRTEAGELPSIDEAHHLSDEVLVQRLTTVRGVGRWTVEMLLIFRLGRPDVLPIADLGIRKGFQRTFGTPDLPTPDELVARAEPWRPWRSVASWYLWRAVDLPVLPG